MINGKHLLLTCYFKTDYIFINTDKNVKTSSYRVEKF